MRVLVIGDNAVSHTVSDRVARSAELYAVMRRDNPGIRRLSISYLIQKKPEPKQIADFVKKHRISYAVVLSRTFINAGVVDELEKYVSVIGSGIEASKIESDKVYAKEICSKLDIKTVPYKKANSIEEAKNILNDFSNMEVAIKPNYYTMGRGTRFFKANDKKAVSYCRKLLKNKDANVIIEPRINGKNFVLLSFTDGKRVSIAPPVYVLRFYNGYSSQGYASYTTGQALDFLTKDDIEYCKNQIMKVVKYFDENFIFFNGSIGGEFIKTEKGIFLTGFSSTFNDPAALNILQLMYDEIASVFADIINKELKEIRFNTVPNVCKFMFAKGYPERAKKPVK
ncbi:MAG: hypothetical protein QXS91_03780, partial [Candidatus Anstonellales archaeon]